MSSSEDFEFGTPFRIPVGDVDACDYGEVAKKLVSLSFRPDMDENLSARLVHAGNVYATLHLAEQQRQRNVLAALTANKRGLPIPDDLLHLLPSDF